MSVQIFSIYCLDDQVQQASLAPRLRQHKAIHTQTIKSFTTHE